MQRDARFDNPCRRIAAQRSRGRQRACRDCQPYFYLRHAFIFSNRGPNEPPCHPVPETLLPCPLWPHHLWLACGRITRRLPRSRLKECRGLKTPLSPASHPPGVGRSLRRPRRRPARCATPSPTAGSPPTPTTRTTRTASASTPAR